MEWTLEDHKYWIRRGYASSSSPVKKTLIFKTKPEIMRTASGIAKGTNNTKALQQKQLMEASTWNKA